MPFWLNIIFNTLFTPIQFSLRSNLLTLIDTVLVLTTVIWAMITIWPYAIIVTVTFVPYLLWFGIATALQLYITKNN